MQIIFKDGNSRTVPFDAEFAARAIKKTMEGRGPGYKIQLNSDRDIKTLKRQKAEIDHYLSEFDRIAGIAGKL